MCKNKSGKMSKNDRNRWKENFVDIQGAYVL